MIKNQESIKKELRKLYIKQSSIKKAYNTSRINRFIQWITRGKWSLIRESELNQLQDWYEFYKKESIEKYRIIKQADGKYYLMQDHEFPSIMYTWEELQNKLENQQ